MSIFTRSRPRPESRASSAIPPPGADAGLRAVSLRVTPDTAMHHSAVAACVIKIGNLSTLEVHAYRERAGIPQKVDSDPPLLQAPSAEGLPMRWRREVFDSWLKRGTAFGFVTVTDGAGYPTKIETISADSVSVRPDRSGHKAMGTKWLYFVDNKEQAKWPDGKLWVAPSPYTLPGAPVGISPIEMALGAIRLGLAAENYGASWFYDGSTPNGVLSTDQVLTPETATTVKQRFRKGLEDGGPAVLGAGLKYDRVQVAANESQFLETLDRNIATVCRFFLVPPEEVGASSGNSMTYATVEGRSLSLLVGCYGPWIAHYQATMDAITPRPLNVRIETDGLTRLDAKTRTDLDVADLRAGIRTREEVRRSRALGALDPADSTVWPPFSTAPPATSADERPSVRQLAETLQKMYLSVGIIISAEEAREIVNREGAGLIGPAPGGP